MRIVLGTAVLSFLLVCGCGEGSSDRDKALELCAEKGGVVASGAGDDGRPIELCRFEETQHADDGDITLSYECELTALYHGRCADSPGEDGVNGPSPIVDTCPSCPDPVRKKFFEQIEDILLKLDDTGYTHQKHSAPYSTSTFDLYPGYTALKDRTDENPIASYDLFLDCSGFVGYYVIQGLAPELFAKIPTSYSCDRPLAADFVDLFEDADAYAGTEATEAATACWSRVPHIKDALPGDVIAYRHDGVNYTEKSCPSPSTKTYLDPDRNTGHVLFVFDRAYRSAEKKDGKGAYQWVVTVADSTNVPHMFDSRKLNAGDEDRSVYKSNAYHAWTRGDGDAGLLQRCVDAQGDRARYHRNCADHGLTQAGPVIVMDTPATNDNPTGAGTGRMYVNDGMDGYRGNYSQSTQKATVVIGRPVPCGGE